MKLNLILVAASCVAAFSPSLAMHAAEPPANFAAVGAKTSQNGPFRTDPAQGIPKHAYSPFDKLNQPPPYQPAVGRDFLPGKLVIKLKPASPASSKLTSAVPDAAALQQKFAAYGVITVERVFPNAQPPGRRLVVGGTSITTLPPPDLTRWLRARCAEDQDVQELAKQLAADPDVDIAEPDFIRRPAGYIPHGEADPLFASQWHLAAAKIPEAWAYLDSQGLPPGGNRDIVVAVIDTGVDYNHPDLAPNMWVNSREIAGNGVDDDGNGFVDDLHGCSTVSNSGSHTGNPMDDHGHGTHVAGIIGAPAGNSNGVVGVAYNCQIMAIKAAQYSGVLAASDIAEAINYAVANGADIINMSFGGYAKSQVEEDALAVAFGQCVLVAAAGNDGVPNEPCDVLVAPRPMYPAAYNWVLGVMARTQSPDAKGNYLAGFSNIDGVPNTTVEYELMAPGVDVWSTLPGNQYAAWDGTSMAAPIISGIAALARTRWSDKNIYSSRFIMGQIATTGGSLQGRLTSKGVPVSYFVADALAALTTAPKPQLTYLQHWLFDTSLQAANNDNDGIVDAGETIDLAIVIRNHWGQANQVSATLEAWAQGAVQPDPYVTWITNTVDYGAIGSFNWDDNGLIYNNQVITGVRYPFRFTVSPNCPNDHAIPLRLTLSCRNGLDPSDATTYTVQSRFQLMVQRGRELPRIISQDITITKDDLWLVPDQTLIESNATVTVQPGTQIEFWSLDPQSPYASQAKAYLQVEGTLLIEGTASEPVELFPNPLMLDRGVEIVPVGNGWFEFRYARVENPLCLRQNGTLPRDLIDHCYFSQGTSVLRTSWRLGDQWGAFASAARVQRSVFRAVGNGYKPMSCGLTCSSDISSPSFENLYDGCGFLLWSDPSHPGLFMSTTHTYATTGYWTEFRRDPPCSELEAYGRAAPWPGESSRPTGKGTRTFALSQNLTFDYAETLAQRLGGHLVTINDAMENSFLSAYRQQCYNQPVFALAYPANTGAWDQFSGDFGIGLMYRNERGVFEWISGETPPYTNWQGGEPNDVGSGSSGQLCVRMNSGWWYDSRWSAGPWIVEIPATLDQATLDGSAQAVIGEYRDSGDFNANFYNNAILVEWWNPNGSFWPIIDANNGGYQLPRGDLLGISRNFWGTQSAALMNQLLHDYNDDFNIGRFVYQPDPDESSRNLLSVRCGREVVHGKRRHRHSGRRSGHLHRHFQSRHGHQQCRPKCPSVRQSLTPTTRCEAAVERSPNLGGHFQRHAHGRRRLPAYPRGRRRRGR